MVLLLGVDTRSYEFDDAEINLSGQHLKLIFIEITLQNTF